MGDLLTYGPEPQRCLQLTVEAVERDGAVLLRGNHDAMYLDAESYRRPLPEWIRDSVDWTRLQVGAGALDDLPFKERWSEGPLLVSHANPFGPNDWSYLRSADDFERAAQALMGQGYRVGVFGHVHRMARHECAGAAVYTVGSVGQPRDKLDQRPHWAMGELTDGGFTLSARPLQFDWRDHCRALRATNIPEATIEQLCRFFQ